MQRSIFAGLVVLLAPLTAAHAQHEQVRRGPVPEWVQLSEPLAVPDNATGLVFVRSQDIIVHLDDQGQSHFQAYRIRVLHPNALQLGNLSILWRPAAGPATVHYIRIHRGGEVIDVLANSQFEILRRENQLEAAQLDGLLTAVLRVADLRVGDELEVAHSTRVSDPTLRGNVAGMLMLAGDAQPGRYRLRLSWENGEEPRVQPTDDLAPLMQRQGRSIGLTLDNPATLTPPNDAPPRFRWQRIVEYSDFADWQGISAMFSPLFRRAAVLAPNSPLRGEARRIAAEHADPLARARAALALVQREVRYVYVGLNDGNLTPATADETWQRRYGDCKGKTAMLLALLAELGIEAEAVLVNNQGMDDGVDARLPNPGVFDHVLVRVRIDGRQYWLDGTLPDVAEPSVTPALPYRWALPLSDGGAALEALPWQPAMRPDQINLFDIDARAGFDEPAVITSTTIVRGVAAIVQYAQLSSLTPAQLANAFRQNSTGSIWDSIDDVRWEYDRRAQASVLTIRGTGPVDWETPRPGTRSLTLAGGGFNPPQRRVRPAGQRQDAPFFNDPEFWCNVTTVRLPTDTHARQWSYNSGFDTRIFGRSYFRAFALSDGAARMVSSFRVEQLEVSADEASRDNDRIAQFDNSTARITFSPLGRANAQANGQHVPTTTEIDWTADAVPCLADTNATAAQPSP